MKFRPGDKVKFLNDIGGGTVVSIIDTKKVLVEIDDGFEIPVLISDLVPEGGNYFKDEPEEEVKAEVPQKPVKPANQAELNKITPVNQEEEIMFALMTKEQGSDLYTYLINNSSYNLHYSISTRNENENLLFDHGTLDSGLKIQLRKFLPENINAVIRFDVQVILYKPAFFTLRDTVNISVFIKPDEIYTGKLLEDNDFFEKKAALFPVINLKKKKVSDALISSDISKLFAGTATPPKVKKDMVQKNRGDEPEEVDLHIEEIMDNYEKLEPGEILETQMARFKTALETAIIHKTKRIVFIHGIGNGQLKHKIRKTLEDQYPDLQYQDASFREYGYGATMVIIK